MSSLENEQEWNHRGIGKSCARILISLAEAMLCPDAWFAVVDHRHTTKPSAIEFSLRDKAGALDLKIETKIVDNIVYVRSPMTRLRAEHAIRQQEASRAMAERRAKRNNSETE
ncbi:hypothetical protein [Rubinisphaera italica]|uniref:Uncharacterized protein n=1 Tax=Rubinisphaera italica TaxID=2527969 RepID=A0A5C5XM12_9PLAN|nr:hypothetical protein [Rubinisphaera italica]TWT63155.1 hypothetical protein Pan54_39080 [Rubinisphaera italica]